MPRRKDHRPKVIREGKPKRTPKPATPKAQSKENITERKYARRKELNNTSTPATEVIGEVTEKIPEAAEMSCGRSLNFEIGTKDESSAGRENTTALLDKENGVAVQEMNVGIACDLNTSVKHASNSSMSLPEVTQVPVKKRVRRKLKRTPAPPREVTGELTTEKMSELAQPPCNVSTYFDGGMEESSAVKENVVVKGTYPDLAYVRSPGLNKSSTPTEVSGDLPGKTMPEKGESSATRENAIGHLCIETCKVLQEIEVGLAYDMKALMKQAAENNYPSFCNNEHTLTVHPSKEIGAELQDIDNEQTLGTSPSKTNSPEEKPRNMTEKKYHRRKQLNKSPTGLTKMTGGLSVNTQAPSTCLPKCNPPGMKRNARNKNKRKGLAARNKNKRKGLAARNKNKRKGLAEVEYENISNGQVSTINLQMVGCEREHSETTERGDNGQASTVKLLMEMVGCEREHPGTIEHADNSSVNLIEAHSNGLHSYQSRFPRQFPNIHKKRRTEKGKTSVITKNGVPLIFAPEDAQVHPYASNYSNSMYDLGYNVPPIINEYRENYIHNTQTFDEFKLSLRRKAASYNSLMRIRNCTEANRNSMYDLAYNVPPIINEYRENYIHNTQTFDEFKLSLRRKAAISQLPNETCGYNSLMRIRNCTEANYNAKQLDFFDPQTIREAGRPQKCIDVLVEDMPVSCAKKKQIRKRSSLSSSMHPKKDEIPQCHNSSLVGVFLTQNVTDHISSSAFMSLAARFPKKLASMCTACDGESMSMAVNKQQVREMEPEENTECDVNLLNQSVCNLSSITVDIVEHSREKNVNSNDSYRITRSSISLTDESDCKQTESPQRNNTECHSLMGVIEEGEKKSCHDDIGKESNDMVSSQSSVVSSQISGDFSNDHVPEKKGSCSDSNSDIEDLSSTAKYNTCGSISKLLEMEQEQSNHTQQSFFDTQQNFLKRLVDDHGSIDLECLRDIPPDQAKEYLLSGIENCRVCAPVNTAPSCLPETHE